jgi:CRISPR-associated protein Csm2
MMIMESFYSNEDKKIVKADLFDKTAQEIASGFVGKNKFGDLYGVSGTQMRRLYDEVKRFDQNLDGTPATWEKNYPYIRMIKSKVSYNVARAIEKNRFEADVYTKLSEFIMKYIEIVKDEEDYHVFTSLFESVYGFYYEKNPERKTRRGN